MTKDRLVLAGYYGYGNAGDELILHSLVQTFRTQNPHRVITVLSAAPSVTSTLYGVQAVNRWNPLAWILPLLHAQTFVLGGGGLLQESTGPWNYLYYLTLLILAKGLGCRTEILALGVDPIQGRWNRAYTRWVLTHAVDQISVRDEVSRSALLQVGVTQDIRLRQDPVLDLIVKRDGPKPEGIAVAVSPQAGRPNWHVKVSQLLKQVFQRCNLPIDVIVLFPAQDEAFAHTIARESNVIREVRVCRHPVDLLSWIPRYQAVVGSRFHALLLASMAEVPFMGWGPQAKVRSLCERHQRPLLDLVSGWDETEALEVLIPLLKGSPKSVILETGKR